MQTNATIVFAGRFLGVLVGLFSMEGSLGSDSRIWGPMSLDEGASYRNRGRVGVDTRNANFRRISVHYLVVAEVNGHVTFVENEIAALAVFEWHVHKTLGFAHPDVVLVVT